MPPPNESAEVREEIVRALRLDLVGPWAGHPLADERLPGWVRPSNWYLTGFLVPRGAPADQRADADVDDDPEVAESAGLGDNSTEDRRAAKKGFFPSSLGLSFLVGEGVEALEAVVRWGDYRRVEAEGDGGSDGSDGEEVDNAETRAGTGTGRGPQAPGGRKGSGESSGGGNDGASEGGGDAAEAGETGPRTWWQRTPREEAIRVTLPANAGDRRPLRVPAPAASPSTRPPARWMRRASRAGSPPERAPSPCSW